MIATSSNNGQHKTRAFALLSGGRPAEARTLLVDYCRCNGRDGEALFALGVADGMLGNFAEAESNLKAAARLLPRQASIRYNLGKALQSQGKLDEARAVYAEACALQPDNADGHNNLAIVLKHLGRARESVQHAMRAVELAPTSAAYRYNLGLVLSMLGQREQAIAAFHHALSLDPRLADARCALGNALISLGRLDEAAAAFDGVLEMQPTHPAALAGKAEVLNLGGRFSEAAALLDPALNAGADPSVIAVFAQFAHHVGRTDEALQRVEASLEDHALSQSLRAKLCFVAGHLRDRRNDFDTAFALFAQGNRLRRGDFDVGALRSHFTTLIDTFSPAFMRSAPRARNDSAIPVFILGMPRSGTSLVEQILSNHSQVHGAGELDILRGISDTLWLQIGDRGNGVEALRALVKSTVNELADRYLDQLRALHAGAARITDKMPGNFMYLGLIDLLLPNARVIHCRRDPLDTCLSCYFQDFSGDHPYTNDLATLGQYYLEYLRLMRHWRKVIRIPLLEIDYELLSTNLAGVAPRIVEFCGLEWDENCLTFHRQKRAVVTASYDQVRREIYTSSIGRHRHYERYLAPLRRALGDAIADTHGGDRRQAGS